MPLNLEQKKAIVSEVNEVASRSLSAVTAEYRGVSVVDMTTLRNQARQAGVYLKVVRNTLARRAVQDTPFECMQSALTGPLLLAFTDEEPGAAARLLKNFAKENEAIKVTSVAIGGQLLDGSHLDKVASLPTRDEAIAQLMSVMQAPITKLVRTIQAPHEKLVRTFAAVRDAKQ